MIRRTLAAALLAAVSLSARAEAPLSKPQIEQLVHDYLLAHPEVVMQAAQKYAEQQEKSRTETARQVIAQRGKDVFADPASPALGAANPDVTVVEFFDYQCGYCKKMQPAVEKLLGEDKHLRIVMREFPVLGPNSVVAAKAALAAQRQGKYEPFHDALLASTAKLDDAAIDRIATQVGLDITKLHDDMGAPEIAAEIVRTHELADAMRINGTPAIVIGQDLHPGMMSYEQLRERIAAVRAKESRPG